MFYILGYSISLAEILGLLVTVIGIWLVVRQLAEAKLTSQMEGLLTLGQMSKDVTADRLMLWSLVDGEDWPRIKQKEAFNRVQQSNDFIDAFNNLNSFYELLSVLVRRKILDRDLAYDRWGLSITLWWKRLEKVVWQERIEFGEPLAYANWEWLAREFEQKSA